jgi:sensor domain CHASE-containing protein
MKKQKLQHSSKQISFGERIQDSVAGRELFEKTYQEVFQEKPDYVAGNYTAATSFLSRMRDSQPYQD